MSDTYQALLDCSAHRHEARRLALTVAGVLAGHELITRVLSDECVLGGSGFHAGTGCARAYRPDRPGANRFWTLRTSGVEVRAEPWVNVFGFTVFEDAVCPRCGARREEEFLVEFDPIRLVATGIDVDPPEIRISPNCPAAMAAD